MAQQQKQIQIQFLFIVLKMMRVMWSKIGKQNLLQIKS